MIWVQERKCKLWNGFNQQTTFQSYQMLLRQWWVHIANSELSKVHRSRLLKVNNVFLLLENSVSGQQWYGTLKGKRDKWKAGWCKTWLDVMTQDVKFLAWAERSGKPLLMCLVRQPGCRQQWWGWWWWIGWWWMMVTIVRRRNRIGGSWEDGWWLWQIWWSSRDQAKMELPIQWDLRSNINGRLRRPVFSRWSRTANVKYFH